jgi:phage gpG-like protein
VSLELRFSGWKAFHAKKDTAEIHRWLQSVADAGTKIFRNSMRSGPGPSSPGQYPASQTGRLRASISSQVTESEATIGSNMSYSIYLRMGTSKMARRKMSDDALKEGVQQGRLGRWVRWSR